MFRPGIPQWYSGLDDRGFESRHGLGISFFTTASRPAVGFTDPPMQWVTGAISLAVKQPEVKMTTHLQSSAEVKNAWSYTSTSPILLRGVVLS
jgi:hypothetical protein